MKNLRKEFKKTVTEPYLTLWILKVEKLKMLILIPGNRELSGLVMTGSIFLILE